MNVEEYKVLKASGLKRLEIANHFNVGENQLKKWISKNGVATPAPKVMNAHRFSSYNEESCYWAGFLAADGCVTGGTLKLCLGYDDHSHIEKFKEYMGSSHKITVNTDRYYRSEISFKEKTVIEDLNSNFNITPNKSLTYKFPTKMPEELFRHFLRGYFDGDGCICESFSNKNSVTATLYTTITGSEFLIEELYKIIGLEGTIQQKPGCKTIKYCTNKSFILLDLMYKDSNTHLTRKFELYKKVTTSRKTR